MNTGLSINLIAHLYDFLENREPTERVNALRVSARVKRQFQIFRALVAGVVYPRDLAIKENVETNGQFFTKFMGFYLIEDEQLEEDEFVLTGLKEDA